MMPVYRYMDSHPMRGDHVPPMQHYHPSFGAIPPHMHVDPSKSAALYGLCPNGNNFGYSVPCHACCGHGNFTGYYVPRPSCSHFPLPQYQCYGYPPYHETVPVQYVPSPHYSMEQPRYEYDKVVSSNNHCCGCRSHTHDQKRDESVKVEELDPDSQKKEGDSLVPFQVKNYPYPVVWIPPDKIKNGEDRKPVDSEMASGEKASRVMKPPESVKPPEENPRVWNGWVPLDLKSFGPFMQAEDQKRTQNHQNEDELQQFPFPIFWLPPYNKQNDTSNKDGAQTIASSKPVDEPPSAVKFFPVKLPGSSDGCNKLLEGQYNSRDQGSSGTESTPVKQMEMHGEKKEGVNQKSIPEQQMEAFREKEDSEGIGKRGRTASLKNAEGNPTGNSSETCAKRQSLAPPKASKLPPVCLRVDPLPKKKNGSSGSRSPSPPGSKGQLQEASKDTSKPSASSDLKANIHHDAQVQNVALSSGKEVEANKNEGKIIEVVQRKSIENKDGEARNESQTQTPVALTDLQKEVFRNPKTEEAETYDGKYAKKEDQGASDVTDLAAGEATKSKEVTDATRSAIDENKEQRKNLSDEAAALLIQSAYRGFEVRRWEPLKKLKQIAKVQEQVVVVKDKIYALESSSDLQKDDQQRLVIGEMIMSLLLKLDAIQGLHPTIRDIRKSLARELVVLQEKLDSLIMKKCEETSGPKNSEDHLIASSVITANQDAQKMEVGEQPGYCLSQMVDPVGESEDKETSKSPINIKEESRESENEGREVEIDGGAYVAEQENKVGSGEFQSSEVVTTENGQGTSAIEQSVLSQSQESDKGEISGILPENMCCSPHNKQQARLMKLTNVENSPEVKGTEAPAHEISGKVAVISDKEEECGTEMVAVIDGEEMESNASWSSSTAVSPDSTTAAKTIDVNLQQEFPSGLIDDEAPGKLDSLNIQENEVRYGGDNKEDTEPSSLNEVIIPVELEHQCMEVLDKGAFLAGSEDSVKVGPEKDDSHEDAIVGVWAQQPQALDAKNDEEQVEVRGQEKVQDFSREQEESNEEKQKDENGQTEHSCSSELANKIFSQEEEVQAEEENDNDSQTITDCGNEETKLEVKQCHDLGVLSDNDTMEDRLDGSETTKSLSVIGPKLSPMGAEHDEEKGEELPASSTAISSQVSAGEQGMGMESQRTLVDENEKLREMMERLIETGKDQLTIISNLTARVKDLEKKLSKKKKVWAKRFRTASPPSSARPSVKSPRRKGGVATKP